MQITLLWTLAVWMAGLFSTILIGHTLESRLSRMKTILAWIPLLAGGYALSFLVYSYDITNDIMGTLGMSVVVCIYTQFIYKESWSTKLFISIMASLFSNVITFMFCGTTDTFLGPALGTFSDNPYTVANICLFMGIKLVVYSIAFFVFIRFFRSKILELYTTLNGNMSRYIGAPIVAHISFYIINIVSNNNGILPTSRYFFILYIPVCVVFVFMYWQIFSTVFWSATAMKNAAELGVAKQIQSDMLPNIFPTFPDRDEFEIFATMDPAKEVGGDFYDFFMIDDDHLGITIADVSGKGVPAALFMVVSKTLIKQRLKLGHAPAETLMHVNNQLCENNKAEMFVTCWLGIYEISTGKLTCANAGHEFPILRHKGEEYEFIRDKHSFVLGGMADMNYKEYSLELREGDRLLLYTDGVPEAANPFNVLYGEKRMLASLASHKEATCYELLPAFRADIAAFADSAPQFDDITMLVLDVKRIEKKKE